jgi:hypothetical protein
MIKLDYFLACKDSLVDADTNEISLFRVLEDVVLEREQGSIAQLVAVSSWTADDVDEGRDCQVTLRVTVPGSKEGKDFPENFTVQQKRIRAVHCVRNIPLQSPGELKLELVLDGKIVASHLVSVLAAEATPV